MNKHLFYFCVALLLLSVAGCTKSESELEIPSERGEFSPQLLNFAKKQNQLLEQYRSGSISEEDLELQNLVAFDNLMGGKISRALSSNLDSPSSISEVLHNYQNAAVRRAPTGPIVPEGKDLDLGNGDYQVRIKTRIEREIDSIRRNHTKEYGDIAEYAIYCDTIPLSFEELANNWRMTEAEKVIMMRVKFRMETQPISVGKPEVKDTITNIATPNPNPGFLKTPTGDKQRQLYREFCQKHFYIDVGICTAGLITAEAAAIYSIIQTAGATTTTALSFLARSITDKGEFTRCYLSSVGSRDKCLNSGKYTYSIFWGLVSFTVTY